VGSGLGAIFILFAPGHKCTRQCLSHLVGEEGAMASILTILFTALGLALTTCPAVAQTSWKLITPEEDALDNAAPQIPAPPDLPAPPTIDLVRPDISRPIQNPVTIEVQFSPGPGRAIDMRTFNATYGWLGINITRRLLEHAVTTPSGLLAENIELPPGDHRVTLSIADTSGKTASRTFRLSVSR
jgi:hypothetical protein